MTNVPLSLQPDAPVKVHVPVIFSLALLLSKLPCIVNTLLWLPWDAMVIPNGPLEFPAAEKVADSTVWLVKHESDEVKTKFDTATPVALFWVSSAVKPSASVPLMF
jgi:hypothetical protein